jgi:hypothetical protein
MSSLSEKVKALAALPGGSEIAAQLVEVYALVTESNERCFSSNRRIGELRAALQDAAFVMESLLRLRHPYLPKDTREMLEKALKGYRELLDKSDS